MALIQPISGRAGYLPGANNLGLVATGDGGAIAIDTGLDKDTGRLIRRALEQAGLTLRAIINTHHHADHIGGNDYLVRNLAGVSVYAPPLEAALIEHPIFEPVYLNMGAAPFAALQNRWLMASGVPVDHLIDGAALTVAGVTFEVLRLSGHSINQIGLALDGVCFVADAFFGPEVLSRHGAPYAHDIDGQLAAFDLLAERGDAFFLPGHGALSTRAELAAALAANRAAVERASELVAAALHPPGDLAAVAGRVQRALGLRFAAVPQYSIFCSVVAAHLTHLERLGRAAVALDESGLIWRGA